MNGAHNTLEEGKIVINVGYPRMDSAVESPGWARQRLCAKQYCEGYSWGYDCNAREEYAGEQRPLFNEVPQKFLFLLLYFSDNSIWVNGLGISTVDLGSSLSNGWVYSSILLLGFWMSSLCSRVADGMVIRLAGESMRSLLVAEVEVKVEAEIKFWINKGREERSGFVQP